MQGGAGIAARRLHESLLVAGHDSHIVTLDRGVSATKNQLLIKRSKKLILVSKIYTLLNLRFDSLSFFSIFTTGVSFRKFMIRVNPLLLEVENNPIIHIHNWYNFLTIRVMKKICATGIPVVFTLHDQRLLTGGCHYALECTGFQGGCKKCPEIKGFAKRQIEYNSRTIKKLSEKFPEIVFIAPSKWLASEVRKSSQTRKVRTIQIYNVVPASEFPRASERELLDSTTLNSKPFKYVGVASMDKMALIKGGDITEKLRHNLQEGESDVRLLFLSEWLREGKAYSAFWKNISATLVLSRADNSPNVIHESKINNLPVIASTVGGLPELLDSVQDLLIRDINIPISELSEKIIQFVEKRTRKKTNNEILNLYHEVVGTPLLSHIELYRSIADSRV